MVMTMMMTTTMTVTHVSALSKSPKAFGKIIITIIIMALKGAIRDFFLQSCYTANSLQHVRSRGPGVIVCKSRATYPALITCNMQCATWYEGTAQLLSLTELKSHLF